MNALSANERVILNGMSRVRDANVRLGDKINEIIGSLGGSGTPVNAEFAKATLSLTGVVVHGDSFGINNPTVSGMDVYEFVADTAKTKTDPDNIAVDIKADTTASTGTLTMDTQPTSGDTVTVGEKTYIFVPVGTDTADGEVSIGADLAGAQAALVAAINGTDEFNDPHPLVRAGAFAANASAITALVGGVSGDSIATTETFTAASNKFAAVTLGGGADCSAANAILALVAAITAHDTQGVGASDGAGDTVVLTADVAGAAGNNIAIAEDMRNGAIDDDQETLLGGVNGTVSPGVQILVDETCLHVCLAANTVTGRNWRKITLDT